MTTILNDQWQLDVTELLRTRLLTLSGIVHESKQLEVEGKTFDKPNNTFWLRETFQVASSRPTSLGPQVRMRHDGNYLVSVFWPTRLAGVSEAPGRSARRKSGELVALFPHKLQLTAANGQLVEIDTSWAGTMLQETAWLHIPCTVRWFAHTINAL